MGNGQNGEKAKKKLNFNNVGVLQRVEGHEIVEVALAGLDVVAASSDGGDWSTARAQSSAADETAGGGSCTRRPGTSRRDEAAGLTVDSSLGVVVAAGRQVAGGGGPRRASATSPAEATPGLAIGCWYPRRPAGVPAGVGSPVRRRDSSSRSSLVKEPTVALAIVAARAA